MEPGKSGNNKQGKDPLGQRLARYYHSVNHLQAMKDKDKSYRSRVTPARCFVLADGRQLTWYSYGAPLDSDRRHVGVWFHGTPSCYRCEQKRAHQPCVVLFGHISKSASSQSISHADLRKSRRVVLW